MPMSMGRMFQTHEAWTYCGGKPTCCAPFGHAIEWQHMAVVSVLRIVDCENGTMLFPKMEDAPTQTRSWVILTLERIHDDHVGCSVVTIKVGTASWLQRLLIHRPVQCKASPRFGKFASISNMCHVHDASCGFVGT